MVRSCSRMAGRADLDDRASAGVSSLLCVAGTRACAVPLSHVLETMRPLPARLAARPAKRQLHLLSVGCASGEEPYTLAMLLHEHVGHAMPWSVHALDVNAAALERAKTGRYSAWSLRETTSEVPAILVTSRNAPEDKRRGLEAGASAYVVKSEFDQADLIERIRQLVRVS